MLGQVDRYQDRVIRQWSKLDRRSKCLPVIVVCGKMPKSLSDAVGDASARRDLILVHIDEKSVRAISQATNYTLIKDLSKKDLRRKQQEENKYWMEQISSFDLSNIKLRKGNSKDLKRYMSGFFLTETQLRHLELMQVLVECRPPDHYYGLEFRYSQLNGNDDIRDGVIVRLTHEGWGRDVLQFYKRPSWHYVREGRKKAQVSKRVQKGKRWRIDHPGVLQIVRKNIEFCLGDQGLGLSNAKINRRFKHFTEQGEKELPGFALRSGDKEKGWPTLVLDRCDRGTANERRDRSADKKRSKRFAELFWEWLSE